MNVVPVAIKLNHQSELPVGRWHSQVCAKNAHPHRVERVFPVADICWRYCEKYIGDADIVSVLTRRIWMIHSPSSKNADTDKNLRGYARDEIRHDDIADYSGYRHWQEPQHGSDRSEHLDLLVEQRCVVCQRL